MTRSVLIDGGASAQAGAAGRAGALGKAEQGLTLADAVHQRLSADIVSGRLAPGEKLPFEMLKQRYDASISPLREALQRLASESLVTAEGHVGFRVAAMSLRDLEDINALRLLLEVRALRESVQHGDVQWEARVVAAAHRLARTPIPQRPDTDQAEQWEEQHRLFHDTLISACPSRWTLQFCRTLFAQFRRYRRIILARYWSSTPLRTTIDAEHQRLVDAVLQRDAERAAELLASHYGNSAKRVTAEFRRLHPKGIQSLKR